MGKGSRKERGQSTVEFAVSAVVLIFILFGLIDLGRVFYFDVGMAGATREGARSATWFVPSSQTGSPGTNPGLYDSDGWTGTPCTDPNPFPGIKQSVDCNLYHSGLPASLLQNPTVTCPSTADGNTAYDPPYGDSIYPTSLNQPLLFICYGNSPGLDIPTAPIDNSYQGTDVNVILVMSFGFASGFLEGALGNSVHVATNTHMAVGGY